jgi:hypothetical protein
MSWQKMRQCDRCGSITLHEVVISGGIEALLCHGCLRRWANCPGSRERQEDKRAKSSGKENLMQTRTTKLKLKPKINYYEISCETCNLSQFYHGKSHTRCIHCMTPLKLRKLKPKSQ